MKLSLPSWSDLAPRLAANSYSVLSIDRSEIETFGREAPAGGPWAYGMGPPSDPEKVTPGILCGRLPLEGGIGRDECERTAVAVVKITAANPGIAAALEAIGKEHLGAIGPARLSHANSSVLLPFRISDDPRAFGGQTGLHIDSSNHVSVGSAGTCFLADGWKYFWRDGVSLVDVHRDQLPELKPDAVRPLILACEDFILNLQPPAPPTELQLRLQARVAHRLSCGVCASCQDAKPNDWVVVHDLSWPASRIVSVDAATGEFRIEHEGKEYRAPGHRLFPTAAPAPVEKPFEGEILVGGFHRAPFRKEA